MAPLRNNKTYPVGNGSRSVTAGDFDGDSIVDLATANSGSNNVSILVGNGDGTFADQQSFPVGDSPRSVSIDDFNGDGMADLAVANYFDSSVSILLNQCSGVLLGDVNLDGLFNLLDIQPFVDLLQNFGYQDEADINQDGLVDLLDVEPFVDLLTGG